ncbi:hypothetical protein AB0J83_05230 [Actinoplanes sp. NPDC049596]|uniref:hypothetical protein n=1 Tax=unclassified Actinoplanes TaxID=2626549 RepID=UPI0034421AAC
MRLFRRESRSRFPADMVPWLENFGRRWLDTHNSRVDPADMWERVAIFIEQEKSDREGFLADLAALVADDRGGFATLGAAALVWELYSDEALRIPGALVLVDAGIAVKRARGLPTAALTGYEMQRLHHVDGGTGP